MGLDVAANWAQIVSIIIPLSAMVFGYFRLLNKQNHAQDVNAAVVNTKLESIEKTLEKQFGGNSGGIREAINGMTNKIDKIENRVNFMATDVATVSGRFQQHIEEN